MKESEVLEILQMQGLLNETEQQKVSIHLAERPFSIHWELRTILYLGVTLLATGLGLLIYLNIDNIGHQSIVAGISLACLACFGYCFKNILPFSTSEVKNDHPFYDYVLLLGCLLFVILEGYIQFQYGIFGERYGLVTFIPAIVYLGVAYRFDHRGILSMGITGVAAWLGIAIKPLSFFDQDFASEELIISALILGFILSGVSYLSVKFDFKKHFSFIFLNFGAQLVFVSSLTAVFTLDYKVIFYHILAGECIYAYFYARAEKSFYFLLLAAVYGYVGTTYCLFLVFDWAGFLDNDIVIQLAMLYFMASCGGIVLFFMNHKKILHG
jgi:hypothetical protein